MLHTPFCLENEKKCNMNKSEKVSWVCLNSIFVVRKERFLYVLFSITARKKVVSSTNKSEKFLHSFFSLYSFPLFVV